MKFSRLTTGWERVLVEENPLGFQHHPMRRVLVYKPRWIPGSSFTQVPNGIAKLIYSVKGVGSWVDVGGFIITVWGGGIMNRDLFSLVQTRWFGLVWFGFFLGCFFRISSSWLLLSNPHWFPSFLEGSQNNPKHLSGLSMKVRHLQGTGHK